MGNSVAAWPSHPSSPPSPLLPGVKITPSFWNMTSKNKNLEALIRSGWTPTYHGEFLDLYNIRSVGGYRQQF